MHRVEWAFQGGLSWLTPYPQLLLLMFDSRIPPFLKFKDVDNDSFVDLYHCFSI